MTFSYICSADFPGPSTSETTGSSRHWRIQGPVIRGAQATFRVVRQIFRGLPTTVVAVTPHPTPKPPARHN